jgi:hypothetical protein
MSNPENFLTRWSRRKQAAEQAAEQEKPAQQQAATSPSQGSVDAEPALTAVSEPPGPGAAFDITKLPPIESIGAESDIRAFLAPGVPAELARAALRRAWSADPRIRDFIGLSENAWDFTAPDGLPGFGPLEMTDELRRQVAQMVGRSLGEAAPTAGDGACRGGFETRPYTGEAGANEDPMPAGSPAPATEPSMTHDQDSNKIGSLPGSTPGVSRVCASNEPHDSPAAETPRDNNPQPRPNARHGRALPE